MGNPFKRLAFRRTNTDNARNSDSNDSVDVERTNSAIAKIADDFAGEIKTDHTAAIQNISEAEANRVLKDFKKEHKYDPNLPDDAYEAINEVTAVHDQKGEAILVDELVEDSPYPEVRAVVRNYDEDVPASTIRSWFIGLMLTTIIVGVNALFTLRFPLVNIPTYVMQLLAYPIGVGMAKVLPNREMKFLGLRFNLNPGKFNVKEHAIIVAMANASFGGGTGYFIDSLVTLKAFYKIEAFSWGFFVPFALSTQCLGFGIAGLLRKWLVEPAAMLWPAALVNVAFMYALHDQSPSDPSKTHGWSISRYRWLLYVLAAIFVWEWFPQLIFPALGYFSWVTWIRPNNVIVNQLFGAQSGISLGFPFTGFTLDWVQVNSFFNSPLIAPWHAIWSVAIGIVAIAWIIVPAIHYSGAWYGEYVPISLNGVLDNTGAPYNISRILLPDHTIDPAAYEAYSPLFLSTAFALVYGISFATISALVSHTALFHGREIWVRWRAARGELDDIHMKIMRKYKLAPTWWYGLLFVACIALTFGATNGFPTTLKASSTVLALVIAIAWTIPIGIIQATTNIQLGLNVFAEFIIGYLQPGEPIAMMLFKTFGYITMVQALYFCQDLKMGHYLHVPQRSLFSAQLVATVWSVFVQLAVVEWALGHIQNVCTGDATFFFTCDYVKTFYSASIIWGAIGPQRLFSGSALYANLQYFWLIGFFLPIFFYALYRMFPRQTFWKRLNVPLMCTSVSYVPPYSAMQILAYCSFGWLFNKYIRNKYRGWWMNYNYITSAGLDTGAALAAIIIFLVIQLPVPAGFPAWWGSTIISSTLDGAAQAAGTPFPNVQTVLPEGQYFGPRIGEFKWN